MASAEKYFCSDLSSLEAAGVCSVEFFFLKLEAVVYFFEKPSSSPSSASAPTKCFAGYFLFMTSEGEVVLLTFSYFLVFILSKCSEPAEKIFMLGSQLIRYVRSGFYGLFTVKVT